MSKRRMMQPATLLAVINSHRANSLGAEDGELSTDRATALDHYHGRPYGNEMEGRSAVVSRDLAEAVDWAMPAIMRVFTQSGSLGEFDPVGPEDEDAAKQESDYVNQVIMKDNPGFLVIHDAIKDTLLLKNGYAKHYWSEDTKVEEPEYTGLSMDAITRMLGELEAEGAEVEIVGATPNTITIDMGGQPVPMEVFDLRLRIRRKKGRVVVEAVPTEEVRISNRCRGSTQESPFTEHVTRKTRSELLEMGMDDKFVDSLPAYDEEDIGGQKIARDSVSEESETTGQAVGDRSMDEIEYCEAYIKVDWDGDGIAELRRVVTCANQLPPGEEWNRPIEACALTGFQAKRMPHRHVGESLDDELADLQEIKTTLMRQLLDNIYLTNNGQFVINDRVNVTDMMTSLPGGIKRVKGPEVVTGCIEPLITTPIVGQILPVVDYMDGVKEGRTGISRASTGLDPDILKQSTKGAFLENLNRASQKIEMITRMLAETGIKELVLQVHGLLLRHQDKPRVVKMRGEWVDINPREWQERTDMTARVGLGTGNEEQKQQKLMLISGLQDKLAAQGLVLPKHAFALFAEMAETLGFELPEKFALSPESPEYEQVQQQRNNQAAPPNPLAEVEQIKQQAHTQIEAMKAQYKKDCDDRDRASREAIEAAKLEVQAFIQGLKVDLGQPGMGAGLQGSPGAEVGAPPAQPEQEPPQ